MTHEELEEAVPLYAAGALDRAERQALEAHLLTGCRSCHNTLKEYQSVASLLPLGLSPIKAPRALKARILATRNPDLTTVDNGARAPGRPSLEPGEWLNHLFPPVAPARSSSLPWAIGLAMLLVIGAGGYLAWTYSTQISDDALKIQQLETSLLEHSTKLRTLQRETGSRDRVIAELRSEIQRRSNEVAELKGYLLQREAEIETSRLQLNAAGVRGRPPQDELAMLLRRPDPQVVTLAGSDKAKQAAAMLFYDARTEKVWFYSVNLPECPSGTTYQLWAIDQKPVSVGTFHVKAGQTAYLLAKEVPDFAKTKKFAVSLEPSGGRPQPTGPFYLVSERF